MPALEPVTFESPLQKELYRQIEQGGPQSVTELEAAVDATEKGCETALSTLEKKGYIERENAELTLGLDLGETRRFETKDFEYVIRPALESDYEALTETVTDIAEKKTYVIAERLAEQLRYDETVLRHNSIASRVFFVAEAGDELIGWSHLDLPMTQKLRPTAELTVGLLPTHRGYGVGTELLNRALDWARQNEYLKVYKNLSATNVQAISFLESRGWEQEGVRSDHYRIGHKYVDQVMMAYRL